MVGPMIDVAVLSNSDCRTNASEENDIDAGTDSYVSKSDSDSDSDSDSGSGSGSDSCSESGSESASEATAMGTPIEMMQGYELVAAYLASWIRQERRP